jgi:hypothetical protein
MVKTFEGTAKHRLSRRRYEQDRLQSIGLTFVQRQLTLA